MGTPIEEDSYDFSEFEGEISNPKESVTELNKKKYIELKVINYLLWFIIYFNKIKKILWSLPELESIKKGFLSITQLKEHLQILSSTDIQLLLIGKLFYFILNNHLKFRTRIYIIRYD